MRYTLLFTVLLLTGCQTTVPVKPSFPEAPEMLLRPCSNLNTIQSEEVKLSELLTVVTGNYKKYHSCADKVQSWQDWYNQQKQNFSDKSN